MAARREMTLKDLHLPGIMLILKLLREERTPRMTARFEWDEEKIKRIKRSMAFHSKQQPVFLRISII